jgi:hypothetical protein
MKVIHFKQETQITAEMHFMRTVLYTLSHHKGYDEIIRELHIP